MGLFDLFSNDTANKAAALANNGLQQGYSQLSDLYGQGRDAINTGYGSAEGVLSGAVDKFGAGADAYGDATGANGPEGLARATSNFTNSGYGGVYGFTNDQAQQAIQRAHAAAGNPLSGNADTDAAKYAAGLASQTYGQFVSGLAPYLSGYGGATQNLATAYTGQAGALNASDMAQGGAANTTQTGIGANLAGAELNNYKVGANQLNALVGAGQLALGMPPTSFAAIGGGSTGGTGGGGSSVPIGQTAGQPFNWGNTPIATLFSGFGGSGSS